MREHTARFIVEAAPADIWAVLHPPPPAGSTTPRVIDYGAGVIEVLREGDEDGAGLVRMCTFRVPRWLLSGGVGRSFECVVEARANAFSRYIAVGRPLWSRAEGTQRYEDLGDGRTRVTFVETYAAYGRFAARLEAAVHHSISRDNERLIGRALGYCGATTRI